MAEGYGVPIYAVKANTVAQIASTLQQALGLEDDQSVEPELESGKFAYSGDEDDEWDALEEARLAVEQVVIPEG